ncbi:hypothetical protein [Reyranella sp.]|uniref:hypothetical protein n=1 Tax=Reyranella sp. TaxID=1929291 RepID=UPI003BAC5AFD
MRLASGRMARLGFSLADPLDASMARAMKAHDAAHLGLLIVLDDPESLEEVVVWFHQTTSLTLVAQTGDIAIGEEVRSLLPRYFAAFFDEIRDVAPALADVRLAMPRTRDKNLH